MAQEKISRVSQIYFFAGILTDFEENRVAWRNFLSTNMLEGLNKEIRRRTNVVGIFPNLDSYLRLATTYLMEYAEDWSVSRAYLNSKSIQTLLRIED